MHVYMDWLPLAWLPVDRFHAGPVACGLVAGRTGCLEFGCLSPIDACRFLYNPMESYRIWPAGLVDCGSVA